MVAWLVMNGWSALSYTAHVQTAAAVPPARPARAPPRNHHRIEASSMPSTAISAIGSAGSLRLFASALAMTATSTAMLQVPVRRTATSDGSPRSASRAAAIERPKTTTKPQLIRGSSPVRTVVWTRANTHAHRRNRQISRSVASRRSVSLNAAPPSCSTDCPHGSIGTK